MLRWPEGSLLWIERPGSGFNGVGEGRGGGVIDGCSAVIEEMVYTSTNTQTTCPAGQNAPDWMAVLQLS